MDMALLCVPLEDTTGHNGKKDFNLAADRPAEPLSRRWRRTRWSMPARSRCRSSLLDDAPDDAFNLNIYFDKAIAAAGFYGMMLEGHWLTVGTPGGDRRRGKRRSGATGRWRRRWASGASQGSDNSGRTALPEDARSPRPSATGG